MIELITVMIVIGILSAIGAGRFFDKSGFDGRDYADQSKALIRYAQKLAIAQNRTVFVRSDGDGFAVCFDSGCTANNLALAPGGSNSGSSATKAWCLSGGYVQSWLCEGRPAGIAVAVNGAARDELAAGGYFSFDAMGRPIGKPNGAGVTPAFTQLVINFSGGGSTYKLTIEPETGYVHN